VHVKLWVKKVCPYNICCNFGNCCPILIIFQHVRHQISAPKIYLCRPIVRLSSHTKTNINMKIFAHYSGLCSKTRHFFNSLTHPRQFIGTSGQRAVKYDFPFQKGLVETLDNCHLRTYSRAKLIYTEMAYGHWTRIMSPMYDISSTERLLSQLICTKAYMPRQLKSIHATRMESRCWHMQLASCIPLWVALVECYW